MDDCNTVRSFIILSRTSPRTRLVIYDRRPFLLQTDETCPDRAYNIWRVVDIVSSLFASVQSSKINWKIDKPFLFFFFKSLLFFLPRRAA